MPNHVYSRLILSGEQTQIDDFINGSKAINEKGEECFDFTKHCPMPEELVGTSSPPKIVSNEELLIRLEDMKNDPIKKMMGRPITQEQSDSLIRKYGCNDWYNWANKHWGTKWGCYSIESTESPNEFLFQTAWSPATPMWKQISQKFPDVKFQTFVVDEGGGFTCEFIYEKGNCEGFDYTGEDKKPIYDKVAYPHYFYDNYNEDDDEEE